jgi:hypothetical protein
VHAVEFAIDSLDDLHLHQHQRCDQCTLQQLFHQHVVIQADADAGHGDGYANS